MNVSDILKDSFKFPASNWKRFLILGIIILFSSLFAMFTVYFKFNPYIFSMFLPSYFLIILSQGYLLWVIEVSINEENELPAFNNWIKMFIDGLKVFLVTLVYYIIPTIVLIIGLFLTFDISSGEFLFGNLEPAAIIVLSIAILLYVFFMFFYEIGLANMAYKGKLEAAFSLSEIMDIIKEIGNKKYIGIFIFLLMIMAVSYIIEHFLDDKFVIGVIIMGLLISPYLSLIEFRAIGLIYKESLE